jgi:hypothetical protein
MPGNLHAFQGSVRPALQERERERKIDTQWWAVGTVWTFKEDGIFNTCARKFFLTFYYAKFASCVYDSVILFLQQVLI